MRIAFLSLFLVVAAASAQENSVAPSVQTSPQVEKASELSFSEKQRRSSEALKLMRSALSDVIKKVDEARRTKDVVKLNCAKQKLTQIKGFLRISEQADVALQEAQNDDTKAAHEYTKIAIARQQVTILRSAVEECIGQLAFRTDLNAVVEVEEPENLTSNDPTRPKRTPNVTVRPPPTSPTR